MEWFRKVVIEGNISLLDEAIGHFYSELDTARNELKVKGSLEQSCARLPGIFEHRFSQLQEIDAILEHMNIELKKIRSKFYRKYLENYGRDLSQRDIERYIDGEDDVTNWANAINKLALVRNLYAGLEKALDKKHWQLSNIVNLRTHGLEDTLL